MNDLKAYKCGCQNDDPDGCGSQVVFAANRNEARQKDDRDCECDFIDRTYTRAKGFDRFAPGPPTIKQYLSQGWLWPCFQCSRVYGLTTESIVGDDRIYCCQECMDEDEATTRRRHEMHPEVEVWKKELASIEAMKRETT